MRCLQNVLYITKFVSSLSSIISVFFVPGIDTAAGLVYVGFVIV
jgi:hypothetical protein